MITKIYIDGFRQFKSFELSLKPLTVIKDAEGVFSSDLKDALQLLYFLSKKKVRCFEQSRLLESSLIAGNAITLAIELLLSNDYSFGTIKSSKKKRFRWEVVIEPYYDSIYDIHTFKVTKEKLTNILFEEDDWSRQNIPAQQLAYYLPDYKNRYVSKYHYINHEVRQGVVNIFETLGGRKNARHISKNIHSHTIGSCLYSAIGGNPVIGKVSENIGSWCWMPAFFDKEIKLHLSREAANKPLAYLNEHISKVSSSIVKVNNQSYFDISTHVGYFTISDLPYHQQARLWLLSLGYTKATPMCFIDNIFPSTNSLLADNMIFLLKQLSTSLSKKNKPLQQVILCSYDHNLIEKIKFVFGNDTLIYEPFKNNTIK